MMEVRPERTMDECGAKKEPLPQVAVKPCEFPGTSCACWKCGPCQKIRARREAFAAGHEGLIALQSDRRCRICTRIERYCQTDGQGPIRHAFAPKVTCESCVFMGRQYHGDVDFPVHFCAKADDRRRAVFRSSGDRAEDFMSEFRKFYDASPKQTAEDCAFFEAKVLPDAGAHSSPPQVVPPIREEANNLASSTTKTKGA